MSIAGAGKTKLSSLVIDDMLHSLDRQQNNEALAYFYCDRNQVDRQNSVSILRSFVRQLSMTRDGGAIQTSAVQLYKKKRQKGFASGDLDKEECVDLLLQHVNAYPQTTLILDALDECEHNLEIIKVFDHLICVSLKPIKIFISSRPDENIKERFEKGPNVSIKATDNQDDIAKFVNEKLGEDDENRRTKLSSNLKETIIAVLLSKSQGM